MVNVIEDDTNKWTYILCSWVGRINVIKMANYKWKNQINNVLTEKIRGKIFIKKYKKYIRNKPS